MTERTKKFCDNFIRNGGNAAKSARDAGFSPNSSKVTGSRLMARDDVRNAIGERLSELESERVADAKELLEFLSATMRGEIEEEIATNSGKVVRVKCNCNSRLKAAEMLCKVYGMFKRTDDEPKDTGAELLITTLESIWQKDSDEAAQV